MSESRATLPRGRGGTGPEAFAWVPVSVLRDREAEAEAFAGPSATRALPRDFAVNPAGRVVGRAEDELDSGSRATRGRSVTRAGGRDDCARF